MTTLFHAAIILVMAISCICWPLTDFTTLPRRTINQRSHALNSNTSLSLSLFGHDGMCRVNSASFNVTVSTCSTLNGTNVRVDCWTIPGDICVELHHREYRNQPDGNCLGEPREALGIACNTCFPNGTSSSIMFVGCENSLHGTINVSMNIYSDSPSCGGGNVQSVPFHSTKDCYEAVTIHSVRSCPSWCNVTIFADTDRTCSGHGSLLREMPVNQCAGRGMCGCNQLPNGTNNCTCSYTSQLIQFN
eukprot:PhF_6_TR23753/c0_g1_i3/m.33204